MISFTSLVGTTASNSFTLYPLSFTSLSQNNSGENVALGTQLCNEQHRLLIQKYFDNERNYLTPTIGSMNLTLTSPPTKGATSATLTSAWTYPTNSQLVTFSDGEQQNALFTFNSTAITWSVGLNSAVTIAISTVGVQYYNIPANVSKPKDFTVNIGQLKYHPKEIVTIQEWNQVNALPYNSDIPRFFFIYNGQVGIFPIPSTTGNLITFNYKTRVVDFSFNDFPATPLSKFLATMVAGSTTVTNAGTDWSSFPQTNVQSFNLYLRADPATGGDGLWYPIYSFSGAGSTITLGLPVVSAPNIVSGTTTYTIGQMPLLMEDFHPMIVYGALKTYFSSIVKDSGKFEQFNALYMERNTLLEDYAGTKTALSVDLGGEPDVGQNPNLFIYGTAGNQ